jgi:hypothetical protein
MIRRNTYQQIAAPAAAPDSTPAPLPPVLSDAPPPPQFSAAEIYRSGAALKRRSGGGFNSTILTGATGLSAPAATAPKSLLGL